MGIFRCNRCETEKESHDGDCVVDPTDETKMICEDCLTEEEILGLEAEEYQREQAIREDVAEGRREESKLEKEA